MRRHTNTHHGVVARVLELETDIDATLEMLANLVDERRRRHLCVAPTTHTSVDTSIFVFCYNNVSGEKNNDRTCGEITTTTTMKITTTYAIEHVHRHVCALRRLV
jgi:hypothetical protein